LVAKYLVKALITISTFIEVDADSEAAARERAMDSPVMTLCHYCADRRPETMPSGSAISKKTVLGQALTSRRSILSPLSFSERLPDRLGAPE
jgi:hypothetical protein